MSQLMAETLELSYLQNSDYEVDVNPGQENEEAMELLAERSQKAYKRRELKALNNHLKGVHERITHVLSEAGYSSELPEPRLEDVPTMSFRPPEFCVTEEMKETEDQKLVKKACAVLMDCARTRNVLVNSVREWMNSTSSGLEGRNMRSIEQALARREVDAKKSKADVANALNYAKDAIKRLKFIGKAVFDEKADDDTEKSALPESTLARVNERARRNSQVIDAVPGPKRASVMKRMLCGSQDIPGDMIDLFERYDINDEADRGLVDEMASEWRTACNDVWDLLISIHEMKMLQRTTKIKVRRILYIFKLIIAVLEIRDGMVRTAEGQLLDAQTEVVGLKAKLDHLHSESKKMREKCTKTQSIVVRVSKERDECKFESEKLREDLGACIDKIAELNNLVKELKNETTKLAKQPKQEGSTEARKMKEALDVSKKQDNQIEALQSELDNLKRERDEIQDSLEATIQRDKENEFLQEQRIRDTEGKLELANINIEELSGKIASLEDDLLEKEKELKSFKIDLEAKEEVIQKLTSLAAESDSDSEPPPMRRGNLSKRRSSHLERKIHCQTDNEERQRQLGGADYERTQSISQLARESTTKIIRRSSVRLIPSPTRLPTTHTNPSIPAVNVPSGDVSPVADIKEATTQFSAAPLVIQNDEYLRVKEGWEESEKRCAGLEMSLAEVEDELVSSMKKHRKRMSFQAREFRMKTVLADEEHRAMVNAVYNEALNMENMINRYKNDMAVIFDRALLQKIAKDVKNVYNYNAADNPKDHVASLKTTNQWIDVALKKLIKCQQSVLRHMQNAQEELKLKSDLAVGQETAHHVKVLAEKSKEMERYRNQVDRARNDVNTLKGENQKLLRLNEHNKQKLRAVHEEESKMREQWKKREKQMLETEEMVNSYKKVRKEAQEMETKLKALRSDSKKMKAQLDSAQRALARESQLRMAAEKTSQGERRGLNMISREAKPAVVLINYEEGKTGGPSQSATRVKTLEKLLEMRPTLQLSHIGGEMTNEISQCLKNYKKGVAERLANMCSRYIVYRRHADMQERLRSTILASRTAIPENEKTKWHGAIEKFQKAYWHLQSKQETAARTEPDVVKNLITRYRNDLGYVFKRVAQVLLRRKQDSGEPVVQKFEDAHGEKYASQSSYSGTSKSENTASQPIAPSNSVMSFETRKTSIESESLQFEPPGETGGGNTESSSKMDNKSKSGVEIVEEVISEFSEDKHLDKSDPSSPTRSSSTAENGGNKEEEAEDLYAAAKLSRDQQMTPSSTSIRVFARTKSLAAEVSEEYKKNQHLISAVMKATTKRNSVSSAVPAGPTWERRMSYAMPPATPAWSSRPSKGRKMHESKTMHTFDATPEVPKALELDVHGLLHKARKQLQDSIRRHSVAEGIGDKRPSTSSLAELGSFMRSRRATIAGGILSGVLELKEQPVFDQKQLLRRLESSSQDIEKKATNERSNLQSDELEIQVVQPPANRLLAKCPRSSTKTVSKRRSVRKSNADGSKQDCVVEGKSSMRKRFENELKDRELKKVDRCLSDDLSTASSLVEGLGRRKSTSDVVTLPSISSSNTSNK